MAQLLYGGLIGSDKGVNMFLFIAAVIGVAALSYLLGSLNFAIIFSRLMHGDDIRRYGSGNAGMTNMLRTYGKKEAAFTLLGDAAKSALSTFLGTLILGDLVAGGYIGGLFCILGHVFPVYYKFKGGKGVVALAMMILFTNPLTFVIMLVIFIALVAGTKYISLGSVMGALAYPLVLNNIIKMSGKTPDFRIIIALTASLIIVFLHRANIKRLMEGTENKLSLKKKKPAETPSSGGEGDKG